MVLLIRKGVDINTLTIANLSVLVYSFLFGFQEDLTSSGVEEGIFWDALLPGCDYDITKTGRWLSQKTQAHERDTNTAIPDDFGVGRKNPVRIKMDFPSPVPRLFWKGL
jgi:hypothetical protein